MAFGIPVLLAAVLVGPRPLQAAERPPKLHRGAPIIPWARAVGEHRFRSPRNYDGTVEYYRKVLRSGWDVSWHKIINVSGLRATHIRNDKPKGRWEGLNVYEHKGATYIFIVFSDEELERQAARRRAREQKRQRGKKGKRRKARGGG
jgi:hypothetical protein